MSRRFTYQNLDELINETKFHISDSKAVFPYPFTRTFECAPISLYIEPGKYKFELWGANGGDARNDEKSYSLRDDSGGKGAYVSGVISIEKRTNFFLYIGGQGEHQWVLQPFYYSSGGFNGGGNGGIDGYDGGATDIAYKPISAAGGGGATDIRMLSDTTDASLASRFIIAAGGGGAQSSSSPLSRGGHGGILEGMSTNKYTAGGTQSKGLFGKGEEGYSYTESNRGGSVGGGGAGYYGGYNIMSKDDTKKYSIRHGGAGGSSYVSGCSGCKSVIYNQNTGKIETIESPNHPSNFIFKQIIMMAGNETKRPTTTENEGNGEIIITYIGPINIVSYNAQYKYKEPPAGSNKISGYRLAGLYLIF